MIVKNFELDKAINLEKNFFLFYGINTALIEDNINKNFKKNYLGAISTYNETEVLSNDILIKELIFNKSLFDEKNLIIINHVSDKILFLIKELVQKKIINVKILLKSGKLEKKSKLRNFFEKEKNLVISAFYEDNFQSLVSLARKFFYEKKINISQQNINIIVEKSKGSRIYLYNELKKISSYALNKGKQEINSLKILKLVNLNENYDISELIDQSLLRNKKKTLNILNENHLDNEKNILIFRTMLTKLKRLRQLKIKYEKNKNIDNILLSFKPVIFWKEKEIIKIQMNLWSLSEINFLIKKINYLELISKKNFDISNQITNNFIIENLNKSNNLI